MTRARLLAMCSHISDQGGFYSNVWGSKNTGFILIKYMIYLISFKKHLHYIEIINSSQHQVWE